MARRGSGDRPRAPLARRVHGPHHRGLHASCSDSLGIPAASAAAVGACYRVNSAFRERPRLCHRLRRDHRRRQPRRAATAAGARAGTGDRAQAAARDRPHAARSAVGLPGSRPDVRRGRRRERRPALFPGPPRDAPAGRSARAGADRGAAPARRSASTVGSRDPRHRRALRGGRPWPPSRRPASSARSSSTRARSCCCRAASPRATGLTAALAALELSPHNMVGDRRRRERPRLPGHVRVRGGRGRRGPGAARARRLRHPRTAAAGVVEFIEEHLLNDLVDLVPRLTRHRPAAGRARPTAPP